MIDIETIPAELKELKHWVCWRYEVREGKQTKVPINSKNGEYASVNDPLTWSYFAHAYYYLNNGNGKKVEGVGFVLSKDDPYTMIDLDHCRNPVDSLESD